MKPSQSRCTPSCREPAGSRTFRRQPAVSCQARRRLHCGTLRTARPDSRCRFGAACRTSRTRLPRSSRETNKTRIDIPMRVRNDSSRCRRRHVCGRRGILLATGCAYLVHILLRPSSLPWLPMRSSTCIVPSATHTDHTRPSRRSRARRPRRHCTVRTPRFALGCKIAWLAHNGRKLPFRSVPASRTARWPCQHRLGLHRGRACPHRL